MRPDFSFLRGTVAKRTVALFLVCALLPIVSFAAYAYWEMSGTLKAQTDQRFHRAAKNVNMAILQGLGFLQVEMEAMGLSFPNRMEKTSEHFLGGTLFRAGSGEITLFGTPCPAPPETDRIREHLASGMALVFARENPGKVSHVYMAVARRRSPDHGVFVGEIDPKYLGDLIESAMPLEGDVTVLDSAGTFLHNFRSLPPEVVRRIHDELQNAHAGQFEWNDESGTVLVNYRSVFMGSFFLSKHWTVVFTTPKSLAFASIRNITRTFVLIVILTVFVIFLLVIVQVRRSLVPLEKLKEGTRKIRGGDFRNRIEIRSGDEFEELAHSFNQMTERLGKEFHSLSETGRIVRSVLAGLEKEKIVNTILSDFRKVIPCETVGISLLDPDGYGTGRIYADRLPRGNPDDPRHSSVVLTPKEMQILRETDESLIVGPGSDFRALLSPLSGNGGQRFVLLPLLHNKELAGILALGFGKESGQTREDILRARQIADQVAVALANAGLLEELAELNWGAITALARTVDAKSPWTAGHSERVTALALRIGREMGFRPNELDLLNRGGLLHDIGKIGVPGKILDKPGKLSPEEFAVIRDHPDKGVRILEPIPAFREIFPIVSQHHEKFDGKGYPRGLSGDQISLGARVLAVADVCDALAADRPYRPAFSMDIVCDMIEKDAGRHFDPVVVGAFRKVILHGEALTIPREDLPLAISGRVSIPNRGI